MQQPQPSAPSDGSTLTLCYGEVSLRPLASPAQRLRELAAAPKTPRLEKVLLIVDAHAEGEASRVVLGGIPELLGQTMFEKKLYLERHLDGLRRFLLFEPRGGIGFAANLVLPSGHPEAEFGFIIMEPTDYPPMSGTNAINTVTVLLETGLVPMHEPVTNFTLESPAGLIQIAAQCRDGKCERVRLETTPAFATHLDAHLEVEGLGALKVDVAYGGAFFVFVDATAFGFRITPDEGVELSRLGERVKRAAAEQLPVAHPTNPEIHTITFTTWIAPPHAGGNGRNATIVSPGRVDRSACGTATAARLAVLHRRGELAPRERWVHESILSTNFVAEIVGVTEVGPYQAVIPAISGRSWIFATQQMGIDPTDPFPTGYQVPDTWGTEPSWLQLPATSELAAAGAVYPVDDSDDSGPEARMHDG